MKGYAANLIARASGRGGSIAPRIGSRYEAIGNLEVARPDALVEEASSHEVPANGSQPAAPVASPGRSQAGVNETRKSPSTVSRDPGDDTRGLVMPGERDFGRPFETVAKSTSGEAPAEDSGFPNASSSAAAAPSLSARSTAALVRQSDAPNPRSRTPASRSPAVASEPVPPDSIQSALLVEGASPRSGKSPAAGERDASANRPAAVHVHIGRVEVRAQFAAPPAPPRRPVSGSDRTLSLEDYLRTGTGGRS